MIENITKEEADFGRERLREAVEAAMDRLLARIREEDAARSALAGAQRVMVGATWATHEAAEEWGRARDVYMQHGGKLPIGGAR